jgi:hypothetical protein
LRPIAIIGYAVIAVPVLLFAQCMYREIAEPSELAALCAAAAPGTSARQIVEKVADNRSLRVRTGGAARKDDNEWFDREYLRVGEHLRKTKSLTDDYTVVFAKPGVGYYACIVVHRDDLVKHAWFEDRS